MIIKVWPLVDLPRTAPAYYSYETAETINPGTLLKVPFRNKKVWGISLGPDPAPPINIKLSAVIKVFPEFILPNWLMESLNLTSKIFLTTPINLATAILSPWLTQKPPLLTIPKNPFSTTLPKTTFIRNSRSDFSLLEKLLAHKKTLVLFPTVAIATASAAYFKNKNIILLTGAENKSALKKLWLKNESPELFYIFGTRASLFFPITNLKQIIVWEASHQNYQEPDRQPYLNYLYLAELVAHQRNCHLFLTGPSLPLIRASQPLLPAPAFKKPILVEGASTNINPLSPSHLNYLDEALAQKKLVVIYHNRLQSKFTYHCQTCHHLFYENKKNCPICESLNISAWPNLTQEEIKTQLKLSFPAQTIFTLTDKPLLLPPASGAIILATSSLFTQPLPWKKQLACLCLPSLRSLSSDYSFKQSEDYYHNLWQLADLATSTKATFILGLNSKDFQPWSKIFLPEDEKIFWSDLLNERKKFAYPPYEVLWHFSLDKMPESEQLVIKNWLNEKLGRHTPKLPENIHLKIADHMRLACEVWPKEAKNLPKVIPAGYNLYYEFA